MGQAEGRNGSVSAFILVNIWNDATLAPIQKKNFFNPKNKFYINRKLFSTNKSLS